jgi:hypothetical protein
MRNLLALAAVAVIAFAVIGHYQGWYTFRRSATPDGRQTIQVDVDTKRIENNVNEAKKEVGEFIRGK